MSTIDYVARIHDGRLSEDLLKELFQSVFSYNLNIVDRYDNTVHMNASENDDVVLEVFMTTYPNDSVHDYESELTESNYEYQQSIIIALNKDYSDMEVVSKIVKCFLIIARKQNAEMLITSEVHDEICYIKNGDSKWNKSFYQNYKDLLNL